MSCALYSTVEAFIKSHERDNSVHAFLLFKFKKNKTSFETLKQSQAICP